MAKGLPTAGGSLDPDRTLSYSGEVMVDANLPTFLVAARDPELPLLRDSMAMAALEGMGAPFLSEARDRGRLARQAYAWADEMIEARKIPPAALLDMVNRFR